MMQGLRIAQFLALGYSSFGHRGYAAREALFTPGVLDIDLKGRHYLVTGAGGGLGLATAEALAQRGASVHMLVRNTAKGENARQQIVKSTGNQDVTLHGCDLSKLDDIQEFAEEWNRQGTALDALINNAGVMTHDRKTTEHDFEYNFAVNTLGTFYITELLRPALEKCPAGGRVVTVSSGGMLTENLALEDDELQGKDLFKKKGKNGAKMEIDGERQYARNKRHQVALTEHWARQYRKENVFYASMHPGWADTPGVRTSMPQFYSALKKQLRTVQQGADTIVWLAIAEEAAKYPSGGFFFDRQPAPKHLWLGGTNYTDSMADKLAERLKAMLNASGFGLGQ